MMLCLAGSGTRLAVLLEKARELHLYRLDGNAAEPAGVIPAPEGGCAAFSGLLSSRGVSCLICGGLTEPMRLSLEQAGITVTAWVGGELESVLAAWCAGDLERLLLPGCGSFARKRGRGRGGPGREARPCSGTGPKGPGCGRGRRGLRAKPGKGT